MQRRLEIVRGAIADTLDAAHPGPLSLVSVCAGDGRDVVPVLARHPRGGDVSATLVELDPLLADGARAAAAGAGLTRVRVVEADAGNTASYAAAVPADIILMCGVFGNVRDDDIERTIRQAPRLCAADSTIIWTRHRRPPDVTPAIRDWFRDAGFAEIAFHAVPDAVQSVGVHRLVAAPKPFLRDLRMFQFVREGSRRTDD